MRTHVGFILVLVLVLPAMVLSVSCSKSTVQSDPAQTPESQIAGPAETADAGTDPPTVEVTAPETADAEFVNRKIYFEFDSALLSQQAQQILTDKADYLRTNQDLIVTIEGHCDERGTEEYNMVLGDLRAKSAKAFLVDLGVDANRLSTITYGEERPIAHNRDEASWAMNRRAQFVIQ